MTDQIVELRVVRHAGPLYHTQFDGSLSSTRVRDGRVGPVESSTFAEYEPARSIVYSTRALEPSSAAMSQWNTAPAMPIGILRSHSAVTPGVSALSTIFAAITRPSATVGRIATRMPAVATPPMNSSASSDPMAR